MNLFRIKSLVLALGVAFGGTTAWAAGQDHAQGKGTSGTSQTAGQMSGQTSGTKAQAAQTGQAGQAGQASGQRAGQGAQQQQGGDAMQRASQAGVAVMIVPLASASQDDVSNGCWARFYGDQNFRGGLLSMNGPVALPDISNAQPFWGEADSAVIGPKARVTIYDNDNFKDQTAVLQPNQRIANLRDKAQVTWLEGVESVRVECTG